ncbi:hypothetical protein FB446DRAFT_729579 [Lentinula raphanica]|nr:hypothetical protein FB446DRAFT_729579 [Lentinula raphanica]
MTSRLISERLVIVGREQSFSRINSPVVSSLYEELQLCTTEAAFPQEVVVDFAQRTSYFGIIGLNPRPPKADSTEPSLSYKPLEDRKNDQFKINSWTIQDHMDAEDEIQENPELGTIVGIMYLICTQNPPYPPGSIGEMSFGIVISEKYRCKGYAKEALGLILNEAFTHMNCHRVQVRLLDTHAKDKAMRLFMGLRFAHEGRRRRAFFSIIENEWKDTTCLAILDTDWLIRSKYLTEVTPTSLWDEMLSRHAREQQELLQWHEAQTRSWPAANGLKRTTSMETIRVTEWLSDAKPDSAASSDAESTDDEHPLSIAGPLRKGKGKAKQFVNPFNFRSSSNALSSDSEDYDDLPTHQPFNKKSSSDEASDSHFVAGFNFARPSSSSSPFLSPSPPRSPSLSSYHSSSPLYRSRSRSDSFSDWEGPSDVADAHPTSYASSTDNSDWELPDARELAGSPTFPLPEMSETPSDSEAYGIAE